MARLPMTAERLHKLAADATAELSSQCSTNDVEHYILEYMYTNQRTNAL